MDRNWLIKKTWKVNIKKKFKSINQTPNSFSRESKRGEYMWLKLNWMCSEPVHGQRYET